jgi:hypothetical protein
MLKEKYYLPPYLGYEAPSWKSKLRESKIMTMAMKEVDGHVEREMQRNGKIKGIKEIRG